MPYIPQSDRGKFDKIFESLPAILTPGELNYLISSLASYYIEFQPKTYKLLNEVIGVIESAKLEFYRTKVAPYEDQKQGANGGV